jgi:hypothetical protein
MPLLTTLGLVIGGLSSAQQLFAGASATQRAKQRLEDFEFQDLGTGAFDQFAPSLELERMQLESIDRQRSMVADVASGLGAAEAQALLGTSQDQLARSEQELFARMEQRVDQAEMLRAQDLQRRQQMQEARSMAELQSLSQEFTAGKQMMASGLGGFAQLATSAGLTKEYNDLVGSRGTDELQNILKPRQ